MAKIVRLTESDLTRLVKRVIKEQELDRELGQPDGEGIITFDDRFVLLKGASEETINNVLKRLPEELRFLAILESEFADFSNIDVCKFPKLVSINLRGTENNLEENIDCEFEEALNSIYDFTPDFKK
jgi:hypothetical protein